MPFQAGLYQGCRLPKEHAGRHTIRVETVIDKPGDPGTVVIKADGVEVAPLELLQTVTLAFTASETFDVGTDFGSSGAPG